MPKRRPKFPKLPHPVDAALGARLKHLRTVQRPRVSQKWLGQECGISWQQVQKYESGESRMAVSMLSEFAKALGISICEILAPIEGPAIHRSE